MALLLASLVAVTAASLLSLQTQRVMQEDAQRRGAQARWILTGALNWAALLLDEDAKGSRMDHLGEPWATPLEPARLSSFLQAGASDHASTSEGLSSALSGRIVDVQGRFNVRALLEATANTPLDDRIRQSWQRLCALAGLSSAQAASLLPQGHSATNLLLQPWNAGFAAPLSPKSAAALQSWVVLLPSPTAVNINTAPQEVLSALEPLWPEGGAGWGARVVQERAKEPFRDLATVPDRLGKSGLLPPSWFSTDSQWFEVQGVLQWDTWQWEQLALIERSGGRSQLRDLQWHHRDIR